MKLSTLFLMGTLTTTAWTAAAVCQELPVAQVSSAAQANPHTKAVVPTLVRFAGQISGVDDAAKIVSLRFSLYDSLDSTSPLWTETQQVSVDERGRYTVLLGNNTDGVLPGLSFVTGEARWIGVTLVGNEGEKEQPRVVVVSVPYAMKAADAETLGGLPASAFLQQRTVTGKSAGALRLSSSSAAGLETSGAVSDGTNTPNFIAKFTGTDTIANSAIFESGGLVGIGTTTPGRTLHLKSSAPALRIEDTNFPNSFWELQQSAFNNDYFGFLRYEAGNAVESKSLVLSNTGLLGIGTGTPQRPLHIKNAAPAIRLEDTHFPSAFWELQQSAFVNDQFGFLRYENGAAVPTKSMVISPSGLMGVGTVFPQAKLEVAGSLRISGNGNALTFPDGTNQFTAFTPGATISGNTSAGVVTASQTHAGAGAYSAATPPPSALSGSSTATSGVATGVFGTSSSADGYGALGQNVANSGNAIGIFGISAISPTGVGVWGESQSTTVPSGGGPVGVYGHSLSSVGTGVFGYADASSGDAVGVFGRSISNGGTGVWGEATNASGVNFGVFGRIVSLDANAAAGVFDTATGGNILIGRSGSTPTKVFRVDSTGKGFFNGGNVTGGADFAESVSVRDEKSQYQPGDVIAVDTDGVRQFTLTTKPYSTLVAGIYSTKPGVLATPHVADDPRIAGQEIPLAVVGIVPCKVTAENGEIHAGDLLVSSSTPGYAMKGTDRNRMTGAVVGKALQNMSGKTGVIEVLVSLQ